jgi:RNA polymerase primary sigma factor
MPRDRSEFDDLAPLIKLIRAHPPFDRETELVVTRKARKGDKRAQEKLVVHNLSLVISVARKFMGRGVRLEDLVQEGNYGLLKAIEHFDPEKGNRFSTYAVWWIRAYITRCLKDGPSAVRRTMPNGGLPPRDISLEETLGTDGDSDATHLDRLADEGPGPDAQLLRAEQNQDVRNALGRVRKRMGELAWDILSDRLTQDDPRTLEDLGKQWGLSRERVRQVEKSTRNFLSRYLADFDEAA